MTLTETEKVIVRTSLVAYQEGVSPPMDTALWELRQVIPFEPRRDIHNACWHSKPNGRITYITEEKAVDIACRYGVRL
jgi:hypothetical protein